MSIVQRQVELGRDMYQINTQTLRGFMEVQRESVEKYLELNRSYVERLPEVRDLGAFMALQRDYNETLWSGIRSSVQAQTELARSAFQDTSEALRTAFTLKREASSEGDEVEAAPAAKTRAPKSASSKSKADEDVSKAD